MSGDTRSNFNLDQPKLYHIRVKGHLWINNKNLVQILMLWRRAQQLIGTELKSEIRAKYPLQEAQEAVQDYLGQMTGGKILLCPDH